MTNDERRRRLAATYRATRAQTSALAAPLSAEDMQVQSMPDASPTKWHLAHTTWFFETFVLAANDAAYVPVHPRYGFLFNSYYEAVGPRPARHARGLVTRPSIDEVRAYRAAIDARVEQVIARVADGGLDALEAIVTLGIHHEQQHEELILTDVQHALSCNPLLPTYAPAAPRGVSSAVPAMTFVPFDGGVVTIGHAGVARAFAFDNEGPAHRVLVEPFAIGSRLVTNGEYRAFVEDGGYARAELWLSDAWATVQARGWTAPAYWQRADDGAWEAFTLRGVAPIEEDAPVAHVSFYEADAYARWAGARLPREDEWEVAARTASRDGTYLEGGALVPRPASIGEGGMAQAFGEVWQWTASPYVAYPGYRPVSGALGEYNGKFMCNQMVLRGASCFTPRDHARVTYRNFFPPDARWQMTGIRLAR